MMTELQIVTQNTNYMSKLEPQTSLSQAGIEVSQESGP